MKNKILKISFIFFLLILGFFVSQEASAACENVPLGGSYEINTGIYDGCTFSGTVNGVDGGSLTIPAGKTLTINAGQTVVWNSGFSVFINGSIAINKGSPGGQLRKTNIWLTDADNDGYPGGVDQIAQLSQPAGGKRRSDASFTFTYLADIVTDCSDANANIHTNRTVATDADQEGYSTSAASSQCAGDSTTVSGRTYYKNSAGSYYFIASASIIGTSDCNDNDGARYQNLNGYLDGDGDAYTTGSAVPRCSGASLDTYNISTSPYRATQTATDCNDALATAWVNKYTDTDGDTHAPNSTLSCVGSQAGYIASPTTFTDCLDTNADVWYYGYGADDDGDNYGQFSYGCINGAGNRTATAGGPDCNDNPATGGAYVYQTQTGTVDVDQDGWAAGTAYGSACAGPSTAVSGRTYYRLNDGSYSYLANGQALGWSDCWDASSIVQVSKTQYYDNDGDLYTTAGSAFCASNGSGSSVGCSTNYSKNSSNVCVLTSALNGATDCLDSNSYIYRNISSLVEDQDFDGKTNDTAGTECVGAGPTTINGRSYYIGSSGVNYWAPAAQIGSPDCAPTDGTRWVNKYTDADGDNYAPNTTLTCVGNHTGYSSAPSGYADCDDGNAIIQTTKGWYSDNDGDNYTVFNYNDCFSNGSGAAVGCSTNYSRNWNNTCALTSALSGTDCYDSNASAKPGQTSYFSSHRGDSSYDYNCNSVEEKFPMPGWQNGNCIAVGDEWCTGCPGACQTRTQGARTDWANSPCVTGLPACGGCKTIWNGVTIGQVTTECNACWYWHDDTQICR